MNGGARPVLMRCLEVLSTSRHLYSDGSLPEVCIDEPSWADYFHISMA
jgi:hypothetical protein